MAFSGNTAAGCRASGVVSSFCARDGSAAAYSRDVIAEYVAGLELHARPARVNTMYDGAGLVLTSIGTKIPAWRAGGWSRGRPGNTDKIHRVADATGAGGGGHPGADSLPEELAISDLARAFCRAGLCCSGNHLHRLGGIRPVEIWRIAFPFCAGSVAGVVEKETGRVPREVAAIAADAHLAGRLAAASGASGLRGSCEGVAMAACADRNHRRLLRGTDLDPDSGVDLGRHRGASDQLDSRHARRLVDFGT